jgi:uncharacterized protein (DUF433 family)
MVLRRWGDHNKIMATVLHDPINRNPAVCGGEPVFRGTRVTLRTVLASLADGDDIEQILKSFPTLTDRQIKAAIASAAASAQEDLPVLEAPAIA